MKTTAFRTILFAALLGAQLLSGCTSWQTARVTPTTLTDAGNPDKVRVRQTDGSTVVLRSPTMMSDTLTGQVDAQPRRIPLASVSELAFRKFSLVGTAALGAGIFVAGIALAALACTSGGCGYGP